MTTIELKDDAHCFVCGTSNEQGLQLKWTTKGNTTRSEFFPSCSHQGWKGIVHGGIIATVLDEAMVRLAYENYGLVMTAEINVRFFNAARSGEKLIITGEVGPIKSRLISAKSEIRNAGGHLIASATAKVLKMKEQAA